jgi:hypothetical protein
MKNNASMTEKEEMGPVPNEWDYFSISDPVARRRQPG